MPQTVQLVGGETVHQGGDQKTDLTVSGDGALNLGHNDLKHTITINASTISVNLNHDFNGSTLNESGGTFMIGHDANKATFNVSNGGTVELSHDYNAAEFNLSGQNSDLIFGMNGDPVHGGSLRDGGITGLDVGDQIDLNGQNFTSATFSGNEIRLSNGFQINDVSFAAGSPHTFVVGIDRRPTGFDYLKVAVICYLVGTQIATTEGEVAVEQLAVGDLVLTPSGEARRIVWIGIGRVLATRGRRNAATPVIVRKGALADNVPHRDLRVTKGHSLYHRRRADPGGVPGQPPLHPVGRPRAGGNALPHRTGDA